MIVWEGVGVGLLLLLGKGFVWWKGLARARKSPSQSGQGNAGMKFQRNLEELDRYLVFSVAIFFFVPIVFLSLTPVLTEIASLIFFICLLCLSAYPGFCVIRLRRANQRDLLGELIVAEKLATTQAHGCQVFHDYLTRSGWRIDHILVAPSGIFAIETITERTGNFGMNKNSEVIFDGMHLHFPHYLDCDALGAARHSASELRWELNRINSQAVEVIPVVAIPGCRITSRGPSEVVVMNPEEFENLTTNHSSARFSTSEIASFAQALNTGLATREADLIPAAVET